MRATMLAVAGFAAGALAAYSMGGTTTGPIHFARETGIAEAPITTTTYDELSQTLVTATLSASPTIARPSCDTDGNCILPPSCAVSFPGYISCSGDLSTNAQHVDPRTAVSSASSSRTKIHSTTAHTSTKSHAKIATITSAAAAGRRALPFEAATSILSNMVMGSSTASLPAIEDVADALQELKKQPSEILLKADMAAARVEHVKRQDLSRLLSTIESIAEASHASVLAGLVGVYTATGTPKTNKRQEQATVTSTTTFTATVTSQPQAYNASSAGYASIDPSLLWMTGAAASAYPLTSTNYTSGMTIYNPLRPGWSSIVTDPSAAFPHFNNTSIDSGTYLNISTFVAPQQTSDGQAQNTTTDHPFERPTVTSTKVIQPSATETTDASGFMGFTPAATVDIGSGKQNSSALSFAEIPGCDSVVGAAVAIVGLSLGVALLL